MSGYKTVIGEAESVTVIERSKFICSVKGIETEAEAKEFIDSARKKYPLATHYCYAYIADDKGLVQKFSDDGEPHGTAGMPILNVLKNRGICKTVVVVTRYFGGVKLGTGGLSRAYGGACVSALNESCVRELFKAEFFYVTLTYAQYKKVATLIEKYTVDTEFGGEVKVKIAVKSEEYGNGGGGNKFISELSDVLGRDVKIESAGTGFHAFKG